MNMVCGFLGSRQSTRKGMMRNLVIILALALTALAHDDPFRVNDNRLDELLREPNTNHDPCIITETDDTTYISGGTLYGEHRWTKDGSPYLIEGDLVVDTFAVLEIEAGTKIVFRQDWPRYHLDVYGTLHVMGTVEDTVIFCSEYWDLENATGFSGIWLHEGAENCVIKYAKIRQAATGIINYSSHPVAIGCTFKFLGQLSVGYPTGIATYRDSLTVRDCTFQGLAEGESGRMIDGIYIAESATYLDVSTSSFFANTAITVEAPEVYAKIDSSFFGKDGIWSDTTTRLYLYQCFFVLYYPNYPIYIVLFHL